MNRNEHHTIAQTTNGLIFKCKQCNKIHLEFQNINFNFTYKQFEDFKKYIRHLNGLDWEYKNQHSNYRRKIVIPIGHANFNILLNNNELLELKTLLNNKKSDDNFLELSLLGLNFNVFHN